MQNSGTLESCTKYWIILGLVAYITNISEEETLFSQPVSVIPPGLTLFKACTGIYGASMSLRSLSASNFRSLDMLNLRARTEKKVIQLNSPSTVHAQYIPAYHYSSMYKSVIETQWKRLFCSPMSPSLINVSYHKAFFLPLR